jgi:NADPH-dependent ferric siderophore reductase
VKVFPATVRTVTRLSPTLIRIRLAVDGFETTGVGDEYVRLFFPHGEDRSELSLPVATEDSWYTPEGAPEPPMRTYTIRAAGPGWVDIDFVVHEGGVAAAWAIAARPGDPLGLNSPTGLYELPAGATHQLLVGDLTALPALARLLENTPVGVHTQAVIEVPDEDSRLELEVPNGARVRWVVGGNWVGPSVMASVVRRVLAAWPESEPRPYVWVAGQTPALREIRKQLRKELGWPAEWFKLVGYWIPRAEEWRDRYDALPPATLKELDALFDGRDQEAALDAYNEALESLGL